MRFLEPERVPRKLDGGDLHSQTKAEVRNAPLAGVLRGQNLPLDSALAKSAWDEDAAQTLEDLLRAFLFDVLGVDLLNLDAAIVRDAAMDNGFVYALISVLQLDILAHD